MVKKIGPLRSALLLMIFVVVVAGCSKENPNENEAKTIHNKNDNPFEVNDEATGILDAMSHGFANPELDESGEARLPLYYDGGELEINYFVNASGRAKNVGFLVFIDGKPQPYKINTTEARYEYMHIFELEEDDKDTPFTFIFTPVTGKQGDTLDIIITSVYNPAFMPDIDRKSTRLNSSHVKISYA